MKKWKWLLVFLLVVCGSFYLSAYLVENVSVNGLASMVSQLESFSRMSLIIQLCVILVIWLMWPKGIAMLNVSARKRNDLMNLRHHVCAVFAALLVILVI